MAVIDYTVTEFDAHPHVLLVTWSGLTNGDTGRPIEFLEHADRTLTIIGTWDTTTVALEGSNDGTTYGTVKDADGAALSWTAEDNVPYIVREITRYQRPTCTAGGGSTDIDVHLLIGRTRP